MGDFWCYLAFLFGLLALLSGYAALAEGLVISFVLITVVLALISIVIQTQMRDKNTIALGLSGAAIIMALVSLYLGFFGPELRAGNKVDDARSRMRDLGEAIERYRQDQGHYPEWASGTQNINYYLIPDRSGWQVLPSFRTWAATGDEERIRLLTTPTAYIRELPNDPFLLPAPATFAYYADQGGWILLSPGPDLDYDINPQQAFTSSMRQPSDLLLARQYDPTNGANSDGDIFLISTQLRQPRN